MNAKCVIDNKEIVQFFDGQGPESQQKGFCFNCVIGTSNHHQSTDEKVIENKQRALNWIKQLKRNSVQVLKKTYDDFNQFKQNLLQLIEQLTKDFIYYIKLFDEFEKTLDINSNFDECYQKFNQLNRSTNYSIDDLFNNFKEAAIIDNLQVQIKIQLIKPPVLLDQHQKEIFRRMNENQFQYKLLEQNNKKQNDYCFSIAFNEDASLIFFGCGKLIRISKFQQGKKYYLMNNKYLNIQIISIVYIL